MCIDCAKVLDAAIYVGERSLEDIKKVEQLDTMDGMDNCKGVILEPVASKSELK